MAGRIDVQADARALAGRVAGWMTEAALAATDAAPGPFRIALSGGSTPQALYALLASDPWRDRFPWRRVAFYWGDERFVPYEHPDSNYGMARRVMLARVAVPPGNIHPVPVDGTPEEAALRYERTLQAAYGAARLDPTRPLFDIALLGLGADGHTASLLPGDPALAEERRWVVAVSRGRPQARITLTRPALGSSRRLAFLVVGAGKAAILGTIRGGGSELPAARLAPHGDVVWFVDRAAAGR